MTPSGTNTVTSALRAQIMSVRTRSANGLLHCGDADWGQRCEGLCTVHVQNIDAVVVEPPPAAGNAKLTLDVQWRSGQAEGQMLVDATAGMMFTIGAVDVVSIAGFFEPAVAGAPLVIPASQRVDVSAHWSTSKSGFPAVYTAPGVTAAVAGSPFVAVPRQAARMTLLTQTLVAFAGLSAEWATAPNAGSIVYRTPLPGPRSEDAVPVTLGARFVRFVAGADVVVFPSFQLWT